MMTCGMNVREADAMVMAGILGMNVRKRGLERGAQKRRESQSQRNAPQHHVG